MSHRRSPDTFGHRARPSRLGTHRGSNQRLRIGIPRAFRFLLFIALGSAGCLPDGDSSSSSLPIELRLAYASPPGSLAALTAAEFARRVDEELAGQVHVDLFGAGQLGGDEILMTKLKLGTVDLALPSTVFSSAVESFGFFELPYLIADRDHLRRIEREIFWPSIAPSAEERGYKVLALWEHGFRQITNNRRPITTPEDLDGIKLRTPAGYWRVEAFRAFEANPTAMPLGEVFVALQTGVIDGQENPLPQIWASRFQEVQRFLSLSNHVYSPVFVAVGLDKWSTHPPEIREELERIAREVQEFSYAEAERMEDTLLEELSESMEINEVDRESFVAAASTLYQQFAEAVPGSERWIEAALALESGPGD